MSPSLAEIMYLGREYRYLLQAELAMRNRTRALCSTIHATFAGSHNEQERNGGEDTGDTPTDAPTWLAKPPPGIVKAAWHPETLLLYSETARILLEHITALDADRLRYRKHLERAVKTMSIWEQWCADIRGVDAYGLGRILAETNDLWYYPTVAKVWKRCGVGLWNGERQRAKPGVSEEEALAIGYSKRRRAVVYNLQVGLLTQNKRPDGSPGVYKACYLDRKVVEQAKVPDGTKLLWHRRASRYMAKRFLRDLWVAWREVMPKPLEPVQHGA